MQILADAANRDIAGCDVRSEFQGASAVPLRDDQILTVASTELVDIGAVVAAVQHIIARPAAERVIAIAAIQHVVTRAALQQVVLCIAIQRVVAKAADQRVIALTA